MAHFIKLNVLKPGFEEVIKKEYTQNLINLDQVSNIEQSRIHSLVFTEDSQRPIRVKESLDEILFLSKSHRE